MLVSAGADHQIPQTCSLFPVASTSLLPHSPCSWTWSLKVFTHRHRRDNALTLIVANSIWQEYRTACRAHVKAQTILLAQQPVQQLYGCDCPFLSTSPCSLMLVTLQSTPISPFCWFGHCHHNKLRTIFSVPSPNSFLSVSHNKSYALLDNHPFHAWYLRERIFFFDPTHCFPLIYEKQITGSLLLIRLFHLTSLLLLFIWFLVFMF